MKTAHDIILAPVITENSMMGVANKIEIADAVEKLFGVKVEKVNTINVRGRWRRQGMHGGYTAASKKAIVTLKEGSKGIDFFESMV